MKKSDSQIQRDIVQELRWDPQTSKTEIGVAVKEAVVTLSGSVDSYSQKLAVERAAMRVSGVQAIAKDLAVRIPGFDARTDTDLAHAIVSALKWDSRVPQDKIRAKVEDGWVTLEGEAQWKFQADAAERAVRFLSGVRGISNIVAVRSGVSESAVTTRIEEALKRSAELDAKRIHVEAHDGKVTLKGSVRSWAERTDAENAAWAAPGVGSVDDQLVVAL